MNYDKYNLDAASVPVSLSHKQGIIGFAALYMSASQSVAIGNALVEDGEDGEEGSLYRHLMREITVLDEHLNQVGVKPGRKRRDFVEGMRLFTPSTIVCQACQRIAIGHTGEAWVVRDRKENCPHCGVPITTIRPRVTNLVWTSKSAREERPLSVPSISWRDGSNVFISPKGITDYLSKYNGLHPIIQAVLDKHEIAVGDLLWALWSINSVRFGEDPLQALRSLSTKKFGDTVEFTANQLDMAALGAKDGIVESSTPVQLTTVKQVDPSPAAAPTGAVQVVGLFAKDDEPMMAQFRTHFLPAVRRIGVEYFDLTMLRAGDSSQRVLPQRIQSANYVLVFASADFFADQNLMALESYARSCNKTVVSIHLRPFAFQDGLDLIPTKAISLASDRDAAWMKVMKALLPLLQEKKSAARPDRKALYDALCKLYPQSSFDTIVFYLDVMPSHLLPSASPLSNRALELVTYCESTQKMDALEQAIRKVAPHALS